jgi:dsDNA-binding SOS-regulon protein
MKNKKNIPIWVQDIINLTQKDRVGFDLSRDETFFQIKSEINKLENIAADKIKKTCIDLLCYKTKDLRLFVYLIFACLLENDSLDEWQYAVSTLISCLLKYDSDLYPKKPTAKITALSWLNQDRIKLIFMSRVRSESYDKLIEYHQTALKLNDFLSKSDIFSREKLNIGFERWLKEQIEVSAKINQKKLMAEEVNQKNSIESVKIEQPVALIDSVIKNLNELESTTVSILNYCELHGRLIQAAAYRRALRWSSLSPKVDESYVTALSPFSEKNTDLLTECQENYTDFPQKYYHKLESLFLLPGGQIKLDIQYYAIKSAQLFNSELAEFIKESLISFLRRFKGAEKWLYNNKENCTSMMVVKWIKKELLVSGAQNFQIYNDNLIKENDKYQGVLMERELILLKKLCGIDHFRSV